MSLQIQQDQLDREAARLEAKRVANELRLKRFLDARQRTIGIDVSALDAQVAEKQRNTQNNTDNDRLERIHAKEIDKILEAAAATELNMRKFQMEELKNNWKEKSIEIKSKRNIKEPDYIPNKFGPSSFQVFDGEDVLAEEREQLKKDQIRRWTQEQVTEKSVAARKFRDEDYQNAELIKCIDVIRANAEREEALMKKRLVNEVAEANKEVIFSFYNYFLN